MGAYISTYGYLDTGSLTQDYPQKQELLFRQGGMMQTGFVFIFNIKIHTLRPVRLKPEMKRLDFFYSYFEDTLFENAGLDLEDQFIYSNKVGGGLFSHVVYAAYLLESMCSKTPSVPLYEGEVLKNPEYLGWLNDLFQEQYQQYLRPTMLDVLDYAHDVSLDAEQKDFLRTHSHSNPGFFANYAVLCGVDAALQERPLSDCESDRDFCFFYCFSETFQAFREQCPLPEEKQAELLLRVISECYDTHQISSAAEAEKITGFQDFIFLVGYVLCIESPAFPLAVIAEAYHLDFWTIWHRIKPSFRKYRNWFQPETPVSTQQFLNLPADDLLILWSEDHAFSFSETMQDWFSQLRKQVSRYSRKPPEAYSLRQIIQMLDYAEKNYPHLWVFEDFLSETADFLYDTQFQALWHIFHDMLYETPVSDSVQHQKKLKRFFALCANLPLRKKVLGF